MQYNLHLEKSFENADVISVQDEPCLVVEATGSYITIEEFKTVFNYIGTLVKRDSIVKLIFDKRKLTVFHQPSMEWYFVEWKEEMFHYGLKTHRKILPDDIVFIESVKIGREQIAEKYPNGKFNEMDIAYRKNIEDAINS